MTDARDLETKFWKALRSDRTLMIGLSGVEDGLGQPMTAQVEEDGDRHTVWIFTAKDTDFAEAVGVRHRAVAHFVDKGHDLFANITGGLVIDNDPAVIDRLWNSWVAAWFEGGRNDPKLTLLRFDADHAKIWLNATPLGAAIEWLFHRDPKRSYRDKVAEVAL